MSFNCGLRNVKISASVLAQKSLISQALPVPH